MPTPDEMQDQWFEVTDFSPGCYTHTNTTGNVDRLLEAPPGSADAAGTFACYSLPQGGLGAFPRLDNSYGWTASDSSVSPNYIVGLLVHDELANNHTEAFVILEFDTGSVHSWSAYSFDVDTPTFHAIVDTSNASAPGLFGSPYPTFTRAYVTSVGSVTFTDATDTVTVVSGGFPNFEIGDTVTILRTTSGDAYVPLGTIVTNIVGNTMTLSNNVTVVGGGSVTGTLGTPGTAGVSPSSTQTPGQPVIVFPNGGPATATDATSGQVYMYPDPSNPSVFSALPLITGTGSTWSSVAGQVLCYDNRVLCLAGVLYPYPLGGGFDTNEDINYTDPPNSTLYGFQQTVLAAEAPYGYGCGLSISAGELFIVKKRGGAILVTGDIFSPNVTSLPGVQSTGGFYGRADSGMAGGFYCSEANGAWLWNGGSTSQKISTQLDDDFFMVPASGSIGSANYGFFVQSIGDKVYFSNNWMFDTRTNSWWKYHPDSTQGGVDLYYVQPVSGPFIYASPLSFTANNNDWLFRFNLAEAEQHWQWTSLPTTLQTNDRVSDVREVVIVATCTASAACQVTLTILDKGAVVWGPTTQSGFVDDGPDYIRFNTAGLGVTRPQFRINVDNTVGGVVDMPIIDGYKVRYRPRAHQAVQD